MSKRDNQNTSVIILAYIHRYGFPLLVCISPLCFMSTSSGDLLFTGIVSIIYALYSFIGYVRRWKHIYCSYQNAYHTKMTPNHINWSEIKKCDAYGVPIVFGALGIAAIFASAFPDLVIIDF